MSEQREPVQMTVNGQAFSGTVEPRKLLSDYLRWSRRR